MTVSGTTFEVNSRIGKLWDLLGHFDKKDTGDFIKQFYNVVLAYDNCATLA